MEKVNQKVAAPVADKVIEPVVNTDLKVSNQEDLAKSPNTKEEGNEPLVLNPFEVSLVEFIQSIPNETSIEEYMKGYSEAEIESVKREVAIYNKLKK